MKDSCLIVSLIEKVIKRSVWQNAPFLFYNLVVVSLKDLFYLSWEMCSG